MMRIQPAEATSGPPHRGPYALVRIDNTEKIARRLSLDEARTRAREWNGAHVAREWVVIEPPPLLGAKKGNQPRPQQTIRVRNTEKSLILPGVRIDRADTL